MTSFKIHLVMAFIVFASTVNLNCQQIDCTRSAILHDGPTYSISGTAILERFDNGDLQLRLADDFLTDRGPDVQIFLSNDSTSIAGALMLADIGDVDGLNHFSGTITFPIPAGTSISQYKYVVFRCITFNAYWGGGTFSLASCGETSEEEPEEMTNVDSLCVATSVATTDWQSEVTICPNDGIDDIVVLMNTASVSAGARYAYIFANDNNDITAVHLEDSYNFEGASLSTDNIFGVSYRGQLNYNIGDPITSITSDSCAVLSSTTTFLRVLKENCAGQFECLETLTATTNWASSVIVCPEDDDPDVVPFLNNLFQTPGDHYAYIITDTSNIIQFVHFENSFDFENSGTESNRVFGVSYDTNLTYNIGEHISQLSADGCFQLSDTTELFLTVEKVGCSFAPDGEFAISGQITDPKGKPIHGVTVVMDETDTTTTNADGIYQFLDLSSEQTYNLRPHLNKKPANGVSTTDLVIITRRILGRAEFTTPYNIIAADANNNNSISASDLIQFKQIILGNLPQFPNNKSWRFYDLAPNLKGIDLPDNLNEFRSITIRNSNVTNADFVGIKIGDVNGTARLDVR